MCYTRKLGRKRRLRKGWERRRRRKTGQSMRERRRKRRIEKKMYFRNSFCKLFDTAILKAVIK